MGTASDLGLAEHDTFERVTNPSRVHRGDLMAFTYYGTVKNVVAKNRGETRLEIFDVDREEIFLVEGNSLIEASASADQFQETEILSRTKIAEILVTAFNRPFSVNFVKQNGEERTLRGRLVNSEHLMGRSMVEDLDVDADSHRLRQVDHRTINWLIVDGVKYIAK